jgi:hypothetical protein
MVAWLYYIGATIWTSRSASPRQGIPEGGSFSGGNGKITLYYLPIKLTLQ